MVCRCLAQTLSVFLLLVGTVMAQQGRIRGVVTDQSGALVPAARVTLTGGRRKTETRPTGTDGSYSFAGLTPGEYTVSASAPQLTLIAPVKVIVGAAPQTVNLVLSIVAEKQQVTVEESNKPAVSTEASSNASAMVIRGADLDALSDNTDDLAADLTALAGPSAGPDGPGIFIDGFSGGQIPPKSSIREVRINQNPFSPEFDKLGFGRVEILTKPGTDQFHADLGYNIANDALNSRNPYAAQKAPFRLHELREGLSGSFSKKSSFTLNAVREWVDNGNVVNGVVVDPRLQVISFTDTPVAELRRTVMTPRVDYQISSKNTLSMRYSYNRDIVRNTGTGGLNLSSRGYHYDLTGQTVQISETSVLNASTINETRFQYFRPTTTSQANTPGAAIDVLGAFQGGGNPIGRTHDAQNNYELQNITTWVHGSHTLRAGGRLRTTTETNTAPQNYTGTFTFSGGVAPAIDEDGNVIGGPTNISSIESYRRTLLLQPLGFSPQRVRELGGGASQFTRNSGDPTHFRRPDRPRRLRRGRLADASELHPESRPACGDAEQYRPPGKHRSADRSCVGAGLGPESRRPSIRAGTGLFYSRFLLTDVLTARRFDGLTQRQISVSRAGLLPEHSAFRC